MLAVKRRAQGALDSVVIAVDLVNSGIEMTGAENKQVSVQRPCPRCSLANALENKICSRCGYPLSQEALDEIKAREKEEMKQVLVEVLSEHPNLMIEKFGRIHGYGFVLPSLWQSEVSPR